MSADGYAIRHPQIYSDTGPVANATWLGEGRLAELRCNARLIAAAPDLLAALRGLLDWAADVHAGKPVTINYAGMDAARAALAKAEGQE
jgi:hypothetical protein